MNGFVIPPATERPEWVQPFIEPDDLDAEPDDVKALRLLGMFRAFLAAEDRVALMTLDGELLMFGKVEPEALREAIEANTKK